MRRLLILLFAAVWLMPDAGPARAQASPDQMNKLSLEALTTPAPGGNPGSYHRRAYQRSAYRGISRRYRRSGYGVRRTGGRYGAAYRRQGFYRSTRSYHRRVSYGGYRSHRPPHAAYQRYRHGR